VLLRIITRGRELIVVTLWERGRAVAVPRRFTDALRASDAAVEPRGRGQRTTGT
jgi:hypothetical protein